LVFSIHDSTEEVAIQKMIDATQRMITIGNQGGGGEEVRAFLTQGEAG
jgi:hypothetical protein